MMYFNGSKKNMKKHYNIAVLGPIPRDRITTCKGEVIEKHGGITNPSIALAIAFGESATVIPVSHVRECDLMPVENILCEYKNIKLDYITALADQGDINHLRFVDQNKRLEKQSGFMDPITPDDVKHILNCDIFVCVPVTDFEITLATLKFLKKYSKSPIIFDAHGPTMTMTALGDRLAKFWVERDAWLPYIDVLKMNMEEAKCSWFRKRYTLPELENDYELKVDELPAFAQHCFKFGVKALYITLDDEGCLVYYLQNGMVKEERVSAVKVDNVVDTTGCGDSFAGGLAYGLLIGKDYASAAQYANVFGAQRTQGSTFEVFKPLAQVEQLVGKNYL